MDAGTRRKDDCGVMPAWSINCLVRGISALMKAANSSRLPPRGSAPASASLPRNAGSASTVFTARFSLSRLGAGVPSGATRPYHGAMS
ncbi:hypothetical protein G6F55_014331 [Rhizopus delemar]|nr:hypothetical protein G6F55_014331 [Rhizopus delemar]